MPYSPRLSARINQRCNFYMNKHYRLNVCVIDMLDLIPLSERLRIRGCWEAIRVRWGLEDEALRNGISAFLLGQTKRVEFFAPCRGRIGGVRLWSGRGPSPQLDHIGSVTAVYKAHSYALCYSGPKLAKTNVLECAQDSVWRRRTVLLSVRY